jgi:glycine C-acetyltransferase
MESLLQIMSADLAQRREQGTLKGEEQVVEAILAGGDGHGPRLLLAGQGQTTFLAMNSNSYLGLARHPALLAAAAQAADRYGVGPGAVRFISGTCRAHLELEEALARFHQRPAAMLFNSAYAAVLGVLAPLISPQTVVISDELNHNSIINGLRLAKPAAKEIYRHLDMEELEARISACRHQARRVLVVSDGVFSMRGDHAPLAHINEICQRHAASFPEGILTIIDDSHGVGAFGATGRGTEEQTGSRADLLIGTLGKAFGVNGGYVTGPPTLLAYLRETAPCYIFSNPISAAEAAAARASLAYVDSSAGGAALHKLASLAGRLRRGLTDLGYRTIQGDHPIVPVITGDTATNRQLAAFLFSRAILATPLSHPVVPRGQDEIRLQVTASHTAGDIDLLLDALAAFCSRPG